MHSRFVDLPRESSTRPRWLSRVWFERLAIAFLAVVPALLFADTLDNGYHLDDGYRIVDNLELERVWPPWRHFLDASTSSSLPDLIHYRPMLPLSLSVNHWLSDALEIDRLAGLHIGNIMLHAFTVVLLFLLFQSLLEYFEAPLHVDGRTNASLFAALIFAVHPVSAVPVNYLSKRDLVMMALFSIAALLLYVRTRLRGRGSVGSLTTFVLLLALALSSKDEAIAVLPVCIFLELLAPRHRRDSWRLAAIVMFSAALAGATLFRLSWLAKSVSLDYAVVQSGVHLRYLGSLFWPFKVRILPLVAPVEGFLDPWLIGGLVVIVGSFYLAWRWRRTLPAASFCILAYWAFVAPSSTFLRLKELATPYRLYPSLAFFFLLLLIIALARVRPPLVYLGAGILTLFLATSTISMNGVWKNEVTLGAHHERYGGTATAHLNYARGLWSIDPIRAEENLRIAVELEPRNIYVRINLGLLEMQKGDVESGLSNVEKAVEIAPRAAIARHWLALAYRQVGRLDDSLHQTLRAARLQPRKVEYQYAAAERLQERGDFDGSIAYVGRVARLAPDYRETAFLLGQALDRTGDWKGAESAYRQFLERRPEHLQARFLLASGLLDAGNVERAREEFEVFARAIKGRRLSPDVHCWLARIYRETGDVDLAAQHSELAMREPCHR